MMSASLNPVEQVQYKLMRYRKLMNEAIPMTKYVFYHELYQIAKEQYRKLKRNMA